MRCGICDAEKAHPWKGDYYCGSCKESVLDTIYTYDFNLEDIMRILYGEEQTDEDTSELPGLRTQGMPDDI